MDLSNVTDWLFQRGAYAKPSPSSNPTSSFYDRLDPNLQGNVEDRTKMSPQDLSDQEMFSLLRTFQPVPEEQYTGGLSDDAGFQDIAHQSPIDAMNNKYKGS